MSEANLPSSSLEMSERDGNVKELLKDLQLEDYIMSLILHSMSIVSIMFYVYLKSG